MRLALNRHEKRKAEDELLGSPSILTGKRYLRNGPIPEKQMTDAEETEEKREDCDDSEVNVVEDSQFRFDRNLEMCLVNDSQIY